MSNAVHPIQPTTHSILHPSDDTEASRRAFAHALRIALANRTDLTLMHVDTQPLVATTWWHPPAVRQTLRDWGVLDSDTSSEDLYEEYGVVVRKTTIAATHALAGANNLLDHLSTDLIVLSTQGREGIPRWVKPSVAEQISRSTQASTLFVPESARPFVNISNGELSLHRALIPLDHVPHSQRAIDMTISLLDSLGVEPQNLLLMHVGERMPTVDTSARPNWPWAHATRDGNVVNTIMEAASEENTDVIVMATQGHDGFLDALRGSTTERVVRRAPCPVLAVPEVGTDIELRPLMPMAFKGIS